jgi:flagellar basal-body rod protein FlgG
MNGAFEVAGVGLQAQQQALDAIASNIANIYTPAFKRADVRLSEVMATLGDPSDPGADLVSSLALAGVRAELAMTYGEQGEIEPTGRALDIAIAGDGFIELMGPRGQIVLWRGGTLSVGEDGLLAGAGGLSLRSMIEVPVGATSLTIDRDGVVRATVSGSEAPSDLGRITLVRVHGALGIERLDGGLYRLADGAGTTLLTPGEDGAGELIQGGLERSNVDINDEMVRLMIVQRAYAANAQIVQAADQMMAIANGLRK